MLRRFGTFTVRAPYPLATLPVATIPSSNIIDVNRAERPAPADTTWFHHWKNDGETTLSLARHDAGYWLRAPGLADFLLRMRPSQVLVWPGPFADLDTLEHLFLDQVLPRLLAQYGELMVHASALVIGGRRALFTGPSGRGKSTLAGLLQRRGHTILSDDCVQVMADGNAFRAIPTYPSLRLHADSLGTLFPGAVDTSPVASYSRKQRVAMHAMPAAGPALVDALYLLGDPARAGNGIRITPLRPAVTCQALLRHTFRLDLGDVETNAHQFARCSEVARVVPAFRLDYPRDFARSDALVDEITAHLAALPSRG